jgi:hypothetical protein
MSVKYFFILLLTVLLVAVFIVIRREKMNKEKKLSKYRFYGKNIEVSDVGFNILADKRWLESNNMLYCAEVDYLAFRYLLVNDLLAPAYMAHYQQAVEKYLKVIGYYFYGKQPNNVHEFKNIVGGTDLLNVLPKETQYIFKEVCREFTSYRYFHKRIKDKEIIKITKIIDEFVLEFWWLMVQSNFFTSTVIYHAAAGKNSPGLSFLIPNFFNSSKDSSRVGLYNLDVLKSGNQYFDDLEKLFVGLWKDKKEMVKIVDELSETGTGLIVGE